MEKVMGVLEIIVPIVVVLFLGIYARKTNMISVNENKGLQQFVTKIGLPCVLFTSCLNAKIQSESITSMALILPLISLSSLISFNLRKKKYSYSNLPMMFSAQESGMLGIPLFMTLFGTAQAYRMGVLDLSQSLIAIPIIAILSSNTDDNSSIGSIIKKVFQSPLLIMSLIGLILNLTGFIQVLNNVGIGNIITETTGFLAQPVSAVILFSVGYNFSIGEGNKKHIFELCTIHLCLFALFCAIMQFILFLVPNVAVETRWAILLYCALPSSFLTPTLAKNEEESAVASSVCSLLTIVCLIIFIIMTALVK